MIEKKSIIGKVNKMKCGMNATIIAYNNNRDISIQFEDGTIVEHKRKARFDDGTISNPNYNPASILGQTAMMNCGMRAEVIVDRRANDIDIQFEDGTIVKHKARKSFRDGKVANPSLGQRFAAKKSIIGKTYSMNCGMMATVIADRGWNDIDIQFEDKVIVEHVARSHVMRGNVAHPMLGKGHALIKSNIGETRQMNCGMNATVIAYNGSNDISIQFEDGTIVEHKKKANFIKGLINNPNLNLTSILGNKLIMNCGMTAEVIADYGCNDITVQFEDGTIVEHIPRKHFLDGKLANPALGKLYSRSLHTNILGHSRRMNCGLIATVIADRGANDIDVEFEDGTIIEHVKRGNFIREKIDNPNYDKTSLLGQKQIMRNGMEAVVIADRGWNDIDIKFEDGTVREHIYRVAFKAGNVANENLPINSIPEYIIFDSVHRYFPSCIRGYRPDWLKNPNTGSNFEIDVWIPEKKIGIEYDGYKWHKEENERSRLKFELIKESKEIDKIICVLERGSHIHINDKCINYKLDYISIQKEYRKLISQLEMIINVILHYLGVEENVKIGEDILERLGF